MDKMKPEFYDKFICMGGDCPLTCCGGWKIIIDEHTLKQYRLMGGEIARFAKKNTKYEKEINASIVKMNKTNGLCPMLDEKQLCKIVIEKGSEKLCSTCAIFPREIVRAYNTEEKYLFTGCPKVVSLLFEITGKLKFYKEIDKKEQSLETLSGNENIKIALTVRETIADFIQNGKQPFWFREFYAAYTMEKMEQEIVAADFKKVMDKMQHFYSESFYTAFYEGIKNTKIQREQQFQTLCGIVNGYEKLIVDARFEDKFGCAEKIMQLLLMNRKCTFEQWNNARKQFVLQTKEINWENMLVYNWMRSAFVAKKEQMLLRNYLFCILANVIAVHMLILYSIENEMNDELRDMLISYIARLFLHGNDEVENILQMGMDKGILSPAFLLCLCNL